MELKRMAPGGVINKNQYHFKIPYREMADKDYENIIPTGPYTMDELAERVNAFNKIASQCGYKSEDVISIPIGIKEE